LKNSSIPDSFGYNSRLVIMFDTFIFFWPKWVGDRSKIWYKSDKPIKRYWKDEIQSRNQQLKIYQKSLNLPRVICKKSKIYKNSRNAVEIKKRKKKVPSRWESMEKFIIYNQLRDLKIFFAQDQNFSKIHKTDKIKSWSRQ
jgi:hypothetical protein